MVSKNSDSGVRYKDSFFYTLSKNIAAQNAPLLRTYRVVVDLIPAILQDPDNICVKLAINDQEFTTRNYSECKVQNEHEITIDDVGVGQLVAGLTDSQSTTQKDSFTKEENEFFDLVCQWLSQVTKSSQIKTMIKKSDIKFRSLVNDAKEGIYICDLKGTFIYANYSLAKILGGEQPIDITGRNFVDFLPSNRKKELHNQFQKSLETGKISSMIETEIIKEDGTTGFIEIKPSIFVIDGIIRGNQGIILDVTERIEKEKKLMYESTHDSLTGLFNNTIFEAEIKRIERGRQFPVSIVVLRLDLPAETEVDNKNDQLTCPHNMYQFL